MTTTAPTSEAQHLLQDICNDDDLQCAILGFRATYLSPLYNAAEEPSLFIEIGRLHESLLAVQQSLIRLKKLHALQQEMPEGFREVHLQTAVITSTAIEHGAEE